MRAGGGGIRVTFLLLLLLAGCAIGAIRRPDGTEVSGIVLGAASIECCEPDGAIAPSTGEKDGSIHGPCARLTGGNLSQTFQAIFSSLIAAIGAYFGFGL